MSTNFLRKKVKGACFALSVAFVTGGFCYATEMKTSKRVEISQSFYFLLSQEMHLSAGAEQVKLEGGAGYLLRAEGKDYVAISVYLQKKEGEQVFQTLQKQGKEVKLLPKEIDTLCFFGKDKKKAAFYVSALRLAGNYIALLNEWLVYLDKGGTQKRCREGLNELARQYVYAGESYREYEKFSKNCQATAKMLERLCEDVLFVKDLRYLLCLQVENYCNLCEEFSL